MIEKLRNMMRLEAQRALAGTAHTTLAFVSSFDPATFMAKVMSDPGDAATESGWLPVGALAGGAGWGVYAAPRPGDQVFVDFLEADSGAGVVRLAPRPPGEAAIASGEIWLVHASGSYKKFHSDGSVTEHSTAGSGIGNLDQPLLPLLTQAFLAVYAGHTHSCTAPGSPSGPPLQQPAGVAPLAEPVFAPESVLTRVLRGN